MECSKFIMAHCAIFLQGSDTYTLHTLSHNHNERDTKGMFSSILESIIHNTIILNRPFPKHTPEKMFLGIFSL